MKTVLTFRKGYFRHKIYRPYYTPKGFPLFMGVVKNDSVIIGQTVTKSAQKDMSAHSITARICALKNTLFLVLIIREKGQNTYLTKAHPSNIGLLFFYIIYNIYTNNNIQWLYDVLL